MQDGTGAGTRPPFNGKAEPWRCLCAVPVCCLRPERDGGCCGNPEPEQKENPGYLSACPDCGARRDG